MPAKNNFKLGLPIEFTPVWEHFLRKSETTTPSELIRRLIFAHVNNNVVESDSNGSLLSKNDWSLVTAALKVHQKFTEGKIIINKDHNDFFVTPWNDYYHPVFTIEDADKYCKKENYEIVNDFPFPGRSDTYHLKKKTSPKLEGRLLLISEKDGDQNEEIAHQEMANANPTVDVIVRRYKSKPNSYIIIHKEKFDGFKIVEEHYKQFKKKKNQTVYDLIELNHDLALSYSGFGLFNLARELMMVPLESNHQNSAYLKERFFEDMKKTNFGEERKTTVPDFAQYPSKEKLIEQYGDIINSNWEDTTEKIAAFLILKPHNLKSLKNLREFKRNNRIIKNSLTRMIEFDKNTNEIIDVPGAEGMSWDKIQDVSNLETNQIIEED